MSAYPTAGMVDSSDLEAMSGVQAERSTAGTLHVQQLWPADKARIRAEHMFGAAEKAILAAHYASHRNTSFDMTWAPDGVTRTMVYAKPPQFNPRGSYWWTASVTLEEV